MKLSRNSPNTRFYKYKHFPKTDGFVGYHSERTDDFYRWNEQMLMQSDHDDWRPFFMHHDPAEMASYTGFDDPYTRRPIIEVYFEIKSSETYIAKDRADYESLFEYPAFDNEGEQYQDYCLTKYGEQLVINGKYWFLLINDKNGINESFLIYPDVHVSKMVPIEHGQFI